MAPPRVHTIKKAKPTVASAAAPASPPAEEEAPVATTVSLDDIEEVGNTPPVQANGEAPTTEDDFEDNDPDRVQQASADELDGDDDLSLLEDDDDSTIGVAAAEAEEEGFLEISREECLSCRELVPFAKKSYKRKGCHFTSGNKNCPAESTTIVIRVPLEEIIPRWIAAEKNRDFGRLSRLTTVLAGKPDWYQQRVAQALEKARKSS
jgi:hypothetical protein